MGRKSLPLKQKKSENIHSFFNDLNLRTLQITPDQSEPVFCRPKWLQTEKMQKLKQRQNLHHPI